MEQKTIRDHLIDDPISVRKRKYETNLALYGKVILLLCVWNIVKSISFIFFSSTIDYEALELYDSVFKNPLQLQIFIMILFFPVLALDFFLRFRVGRSAIREGTGRKLSEKRKRRYPKYAALLAIFGIGSTLFFTDLSEGSIVNNLISLVVDVTSNIMTIRLIWTIYKLRNLQKKGL